MKVAGYAAKKNFFFSHVGIAARIFAQHIGYQNSMHVKAWNSISVIRDIMEEKTTKILIIIPMSSKEYFSQH